MKYINFSFIPYVNRYDQYVNSQLVILHHSFLQSIATEAHSESKWKQLGELAMSTGKVLNCVVYVILSLLLLWQRLEVLLRPNLSCA